MDEIVVYVAGPYRAETPWRIMGNIRQAQEVALNLMRAGFVTICPHANTALCDGELPDEAFLTAALVLMRRCDAVFLVDGWENSPGTRTEVELAGVLGIPVYDVYEELIKAAFFGRVRSRETELRPTADVCSEGR